MLKAESEFQERELIKMEREREMAILRRQHEREIYMLKRKLHENTKIQVGGSPTATTGTGSNSDPDSMLWQDGSVSVTIPTFTLSGIGSNSHVWYQVKFVYSEKAIKFCEISTLLLSAIHTDKSI